MVQVGRLGYGAGGGIRVHGAGGGIRVHGSGGGGLG